MTEFIPYFKVNQIEIIIAHFMYIKKRKKNPNTSSYSTNLQK